jgi:hypothetical protein
MYKETPIICPYCEKDTGYTEERLMHYVLQSDLKCPHCQKVIIHANYAVCSSMASGSKEE